MTIAHLVARAVEHGAPVREHFDKFHGLQERMPLLGSAVAITTLLFLVLAVTVRYTYGELIATLAYVETPTTTLITSTPPPASPATPYADDKKATGPAAAADDEDIDAPPPPYEEEVLLIHSRPITASLGGALRHLRARASLAAGGRRAAARFRGFPLYVLHSAALYLASDVLGSLAGRQLVLRSLAHVAAVVLVSPLALAWTHHVLADPVAAADPAAAPQPSWIRRVFTPPAGAVRRMWGPAALVAVAEQLTILPSAGLVAYGIISNFHVVGPTQARVGAAVGGYLLAGAVLHVVLAVLVAFPALAVFVRVAASTQPEAEECVVPFDRSFGGHRRADGRLTVAAAWRSFDWAARRRVLGVYVKVATIELALFVGWVALVSAEARLILGPEMQKVLRRGGQ